MYINVKLNHFAVQQKLTQYRKSNLLQSKKKMYSLGIRHIVLCSIFRLILPLSKYQYAKYEIKTQQLKVKATTNYIGYYYNHISLVPLSGCTMTSEKE